MVKIYAGKLFDPYARALVPNQLITVSSVSGLITSLTTFDPHDVDVVENETVIDLRRNTILPGFVDVHVHCEYAFDTSQSRDFGLNTSMTMVEADGIQFPVVFIHPYSETTWEDQVTRESLAERTIRATVHARKTLMAGFTAVR